MIPLLLSLSILLSAGRNLLSKALSSIRFGSRTFFICQSVLFLFGSLSILFFGGIRWSALAWQMWLYALGYGVLLICAQWFYTAALSTGNTALCSTVYSMGFILPTLSGALIWAEPFTLPDGIGILCAVSAVILSGQPSSKARSTSGRYFLPLVIAMLASGGLGIVQKSQQSSAYAEERAGFLLVAFLFAFATSAVAALFCRDAAPTAVPKKVFAVAACIGFFFGCCNLLNTVLAGMLDSAVFFPVLNIGVILLTMLCSLVLFRDKLQKKEIFVFLLGGIAILLLNLF